MESIIVKRKRNEKIIENAKKQKTIISNIDMSDRSRKGKRNNDKTEEVGIKYGLRSHSKINPQNQKKKTPTKRKYNPKIKAKRNVISKRKRKPGKSFLQDGFCYNVAPKLPKCRECLRHSKQQKKPVGQVCLFLGFRRLIFQKGQVVNAGFSDPYKDPCKKDLMLWLPSERASLGLNVETSKFLLAQVGDQFCDLLQQENEAISIHMSNDKTIAWKKLVNGNRELCDICITSIFNFHWVCAKCGFVVCVDCYEERKNCVKRASASRRGDLFSWEKCVNRQAHKQEKLVLTQIIAGDSLNVIGKKLHEMRRACGQRCKCENFDDNVILDKNLSSYVKKNANLFNPRHRSVKSKSLYRDVPHMWLCCRTLLRLLDSSNPGNYAIFQEQWKRGQPVLMSNITKHLDLSLWSPESFSKDFGETKNDLIDCETGKTIHKQPMKIFWDGFDCVANRLKNKKTPMILKIKDWPSSKDFAEVLPSRFNDLMQALPLAEYTSNKGSLNLVTSLPDSFVSPDLGPKMYAAYGSGEQYKAGTTNLHLDISDAVNILVYVNIPTDASESQLGKDILKEIDVFSRQRIKKTNQLPGALWHIYEARDSNKIREFLSKVSLERNMRLGPKQDPIHDQSWYLDTDLRKRFYEEYGVKGYTIAQFLGDAVFIPAGASHQVRNLLDCIKVAKDFVSPENISHCFNLTQEFRGLSNTHVNHEDKLQIKNILYHVVKNLLSVLEKANLS